jgi:hypothetical protein
MTHGQGATEAPMKKRAAIEIMLAIAALLALAAPAVGQTHTRCDASKAQASGPATPPGPSDASGSDPGSAGSTGWTGGTGGSNIGTSPHAPTSGSPTQHPETAQGVNPVPTPADPASGPKPSC